MGDIGGDTLEVPCEYLLPYGTAVATATVSIMSPPPLRPLSEEIMHLTGVLGSDALNSLQQQGLTPSKRGMEKCFLSDFELSDSPKRGMKRFSFWIRTLSPPPDFELSEARTLLDPYPGPIVTDTQHAHAHAHAHAHPTRHICTAHKCSLNPA